MANHYSSGHAPNFQDMTGQRFAKLVVLAQAPNKCGMCYWLCQCDCGNTKIVCGNHLRRGLIRSCGCLRAHRNRQSGMTEFTIWKTMIARCHNPESTGYHKYGARGICVCDRWHNSFEAFLADMGRRPSKAHSIDRKDNNGNYEPGNCRWATATEQARNRRNSKTMTLNGQTMTVAAWSEITGLGDFLLYGRLRHGWSDERALTTPKGKDKRTDSATPARQRECTTPHSQN